MLDYLAVGHGNQNQRNRLWQGLPWAWPTLLHLELVHRLISGACKLLLYFLSAGQCLLTLPVQLASVLAAPKLPVPEHAPWDEAQRKQVIQEVELKGATKAWDKAKEQQNCFTAGQVVKRQVAGSFLPGFGRTTWIFTSRWQWWSSALAAHWHLRFADNATPRTHPDL